MWSIFSFIVPLTTALVLVETIEIIHDTDYLPNAQYFDCLHYTNELTNTYLIKYCIQPKEIENFQKKSDRNGQTKCEKGATAHSFSSLFEGDIHPGTVLSTFRSGIELADRYGAYFFQRQLNNLSVSINDDFVCNCSSLERVFGRRCEYELYIGSTLAETARNIKIMKPSHALFGQLQRRRMCYTSIDCEYGLLCLDWRDICDGAQNCMDGVDEENCDRIEMNECVENEFRCQNGLCIPEEYWLDGEVDCQDASDELDRYDFKEYCPSEKGMVCDERICPKQFWFSCGDGHCAGPYYSLLSAINIFDKYNVTFECFTLRDLAFQCEIHRPMPLWTLAGGFCTNISYPWSNTTMNGKSACEFLLKCQFSRNLSTICSMDDGTLMLLRTKCTSNFNHINYPPGPLLSPFVYTHYKTDHQVADGLLPNYLSLNGGLRCAGFHLTFNRSEPILVSNNFFLRISKNSVLERDLCRTSVIYNTNQFFGRNYSNFAPHFDTSCWHKWLTFFNVSTVEEVAAGCNEFCLSPHRINDGVQNCGSVYGTISHLISNSFDERSLVRPIEYYNNHCLNCITHEQKAVCLPVVYIDSENSICTHGKEIYLAENSVAIKSLKCDYNDTSECHIIRNHVIQSFINEENMTIVAPSTLSFKVLPFVQHCDTYFDTETGIDEDIEHCSDKWICADNEYRCLTGQCIPFDWLCDDEWDCSDASDEQRLLLQVDDFTDEHNRLLLHVNFSDVWMRCFERYKKQAFANICNITIEYPCLLANVDNPLDFQLNRPCIELERIGDGHLDCLGKSDERNLFKCDSQVLGLRFGCTDSRDACTSSYLLCTAAFKCPGHDKLMACFYRNNSSCNGPNDVTCLNGTCQYNARCNGKWECLNGEDEYWCYSDSDDDYIRGWPVYRSSRRIKLQSKMALTSYLGPSTNRAYTQLPEPSFMDRIQQISMKIYGEKQIRNVDSITSDDKTIDEILEKIRSHPLTMLVLELPFICNRGIPIKFGNENTRCLCSPSHYGDYCEFHANRISVVTHLNLTKYNASYTAIIAENYSILISCTFRYEERVVDRHEFHVHSNVKKAKQKFYFAYSRTAEFQKQKRTQRNGTQLYSIRFEAFYVQPASYPTIFGAWHFPIEFDFLPAYRFAKILHFNNTDRNYRCNLNCTSHGKCLRLENEIKKFICSCQSGWYGDLCDRYDKQCENFCHPHAICQPQERGFINGDQRPACLCPHGRFGPTCHLTYPSCTQCQNGGSCYLTYDRSHIRPFECICTDGFEGESCQFPKPAVILRIVKSSSSSKILATSIQYCDVTVDLADLYLCKQQVFFGLPIETQMGYERDNAPAVIIIKSYSEDYLVHGPVFYLVYSQKNSKASINMTVQLTSENECAHTHMLFDSKIIQSTEASVLVFKYHELCRRRQQNRSWIVCFRDDHYFCLCNMTIQHAQCLRFDPYLDKCQHCLSRGQCIRGSLQREQDFICLCPRCMYGSVCQFSTQLFSFTLDSLIIKDVQVRQNLSIAVYVFITSLAFLAGLFSNFCSLLVFSRKNPRKVGVGNYLFLVSIMNIISLIILYAKIIHILLGSSGLLMNNKTNLILCKLLSSVLSISTRINYWLTSLITIERLSSVIFPTKITLKKPNVALLLSLVTVLILCGMHIHEFLLYTIIPADPQQINSNAILCVTNFDNQNWLIYNRINILIHHLVPFVIQVISITLLIVRAAKSRARTSSTSNTKFSQILQKQFKTQKELYITPAVIILAALPQLIFTSSFSCTELNHAWQRYALLTAYLFSFIPQICGFLIFVLPSSSYKAEFINTQIGRRLFCIKRNNQNDGRTRSSLVTKRQANQI